MTFHSQVALQSGPNTQAVLPHITVMGQSIVSATAQAAVQAMLAPGRRCISFLNAHCVNVATRDPYYKAALARADMVLPDGIGVELAAKMEGKTITANLNGTDLAPKLLKEAAQRGLSVFLFGGTPGTAERAADTICRQVPGLRIAGTRDGYGGTQGAVEAINASKADILLVAMGVPMQELWLDQNFGQLKTQVCLSVGGLLDFWAGNVRRAPKVVRKAKAEWVWRLMMEPRRLAKRYLIGNVTFLARAAHWSLTQANRSAVLKRVMDLTLCLSSLLILGPVLLILMGLIRLDSKGPALFRQERVGKDGKPFTLYKLRSMAVDSEAKRAALLAQSDRDGVCFKAKNDPRLTRLGRVLRRYSLDELPQILNIIKGEMSVVGPRPALPQEVAAYPARALKRLAVKPGLTGLWQVSGRADIGFDQMIEMDLAYAKSRSVLLDSMLIWLTVRTIVSGRGAY